MADLTKLNKSELQEILSSLNKKYEDFVSRNLKLDMSRGKPCSEQLDLSMDMLEYRAEPGEFKTKSGMDVRNYGLVDGIPEAKELFAQMLEVSPEQIIIGNNSSLSMMFDTISRAMNFGVGEGSVPWCKQPKVKFICPSPGYDRHFAITQLFNVEMIVVDMKADGPDMDAVERLVSEDEAVKGIWCIPKYSNPDGITYSDEVVDRLAGMKTAAIDFRIFWDNAYVVHHLTDCPDRLKNIIEACNTAGNEDRAYVFASTSKITFPGAGIAMMASSENNISMAKKYLSIKTIGPDKLNELRHVRFLKDMAGITAHMKKHAAILKPKFDLVLDLMESELGDKNIASWNKPNGGYFISFNAMPGCAAATVKMAADAGVVFTPAGATFPYGKDPKDRNIRIAPTLPPMNELKTAMELLCTCVQIVTIKKLLEL
ncbi:MAG: aminotransferase class I/II-fold pyridoxal phosphate-dependent enzyme [Clostridiaceae bacterium]|nr:aminotransferase class I/II-fold pyridoxal phosphate-dependent enzyme [Clostridiaceae bacterium]